MSLRMLIDREIVMFTGLYHVGQEEIFDRPAVGQVADLSGILSERSLIIFAAIERQKTSLSPQNVCRHHRVGFLIIDYLQLMKDCQNTKLGATKDNRVGYVSARIKQIASDLHIRSYWQAN
jgi:replicative DNA helicase